MCLINRHELITNHVKGHCCHNPVMFVKQGIFLSHSLICVPKRFYFLIVLYRALLFMGLKPPHRDVRFSLFFSHH